MGIHRQPDPLAPTADQSRLDFWQGTDHPQQTKKRSGSLGRRARQPPGADRLLPLHWRFGTQCHFACDYLLIPISTDYLSLQAAEHITRTLEVLEPVLKRRVERRYLLTRFDRRRRMSNDVRDRLRARYGDEVCETVISENVAIAESPSLNQDVFRQNAASTGAKDYLLLLEELKEHGFFESAR